MDYHREQAIEAMNNMVGQIDAFLLPEPDEDDVTMDSMNTLMPSKKEQDRANLSFPPSIADSIKENLVALKMRVQAVLTSIDPEYAPEEGVVVMEPDG